MVSTHAIGGVATYTCNNGYNLTGAEMRILCVQRRENGQWMHQPPTCERKLTALNFAIVFTMIPPFLSC